jgi:hypothetical protein
MPGTDRVCCVSKWTVSDTFREAKKGEKKRGYQEIVSFIHKAHKHSKTMTNILP